MMDGLIVLVVALMLVAPAVMVVYDLRRQAKHRTASRHWPPYAPILGHNPLEML